jgi:hypothetical protein
MIENHDDDGRDVDRQADNNNDFLCRPLLDCRAQTQAALKELPVVERHIHRDEHRRDQQRGEECPPLPVLERPCRNKDKGKERGGAEERPTDCSKIEIVHGSMIPGGSAQN